MRILQGHKGWPASVLCDVVDIENITDALRKGPYGKCVYDNDNDVMSHQVIVAHTYLLHLYQL
jgi:hypothetical protein